jgi:hypothetical protein
LYTVILISFSRRQNDGEDVLLRKFVGYVSYVATSCRTETTFEERREPARPYNVCDGKDMAAKGEKLLEQPSPRQYPVLVNIHK